MEQAVNVNFRLDAAVKKNMEQVCAELGLSMSAAFTIFAKKVGRERRIPFDVSIDPFYQIERKAPGFSRGEYVKMNAICAIWNRRWRIIRRASSASSNMI